MPEWMSNTKAGALLDEVQLNPEIGTDDQTFVESVIQRAARYICSQCNIERYPEQSQGYAQSGPTPSTDISSLSTNSILILIDDDDYYDITLDLSVCTTSSGIVTELQRAIRAVGIESYKLATVEYELHQQHHYTISSPTYGESSIASVSYEAEYEHVAQALKLSPEFGGIEYIGGATALQFDDIVVRCVQHWYNQVGVEGMRSFSIPGAASATDFGIDPVVAAFIEDNRRLV